MNSMSVVQVLQQEIKDSELSLSRTYEESIYKRDLKKRIELINWVLENMKNPNVEICSLIEARMNETIQEIKKLDSIFESDILDSELPILDWVFYQVCKDQQKIGKGVCVTQNSNSPKVYNTFEVLTCCSESIMNEEENAIDKVKKGFKVAGEGVKEVVGGTAEVVEGTAQGVKESVEDTAEGVEDTAEEVVDPETHTGSDDNTENRDYNEAGGKEPMNPEDIASHEPTAVKRDKKQGTSRDPV